MTEFSAPWSVSLRVLTVVSVVLLLAVWVLGLLVGSRQSPLLGIAISAAALIVLLASLLSTVRGYVLTARYLEVRRLLWRTSLPIAGIAAVTAEPRALRGSLRLLGNGGLFVISGWFWNRRIGRFRAYATDPQRAVLLRYRDGACVVVTPREVQHFVDELRRIANIL